MRWVRPQNIHLTLKFLGQTPVDAVDALSRVLGDAAGAAVPFDIAIQGLGAFPDFKRPKVVWTGVGGDVEALRQLHQEIDCGVERVDGQRFPRDRRPFKAHLTLGRVKDWIDTQQLREAMQKCRDTLDAAMRVKEFLLIKSVLNPQGPQYTTLARFAFKGG